MYWICEDLISLVSYSLLQALHFTLMRNSLSQLNEKTQVESFSTNLEIRLLRYLKDDVVKNRKKACFVTLKVRNHVTNDLSVFITIWRYSYSFFPSIWVSLCSSLIPSGHKNIWWERTTVSINADTTQNQKGSMATY